MYVYSCIFTSLPLLCIAIHFVLSLLETKQCTHLLPLVSESNFQTCKHPQGTGPIMQFFRIGNERLFGVGDEHVENAFYMEFISRDDSYSNRYIYTHL